MGQPTNLDSIVIRNEYYPSGLTQGLVWKYYNENRKRVLREIKGRSILLFIFVQENVSIIRRFYDYNLIKLTRGNFDKVINGRTVSISVEQASDKLDYFCVDIDPPRHLVNNEDELKECVTDVLELFNNMNSISKVRVTNSARSYHVYGYLKRPMKSNTGIRYLSKKLQYGLKGEYSINSRKDNKLKINLDFTPMYLRGTHTSPWALCKNGLICMDITKNYKNFNREMAVITK